MKWKFLIVVLILNMSCSNSKKIAKENLTPLEFDIQGHRGCRGLLPENTIIGMYKAIDLGVNTLEMDVVVTKDNQLVLSHEPWFSHEISTKPNGSEIQESEEKQFSIYKMNYDEVKKFDVGKKLHPRFPQQQKINCFKPLLGDLLDSVENYLIQNNKPSVKFNIETKCSPSGDAIYHPKPDVIVELLMKLIHEKKIEERVIIQSFDFRTLKYLHVNYPSIKTAMLIEDFDNRSLANQLADLGFVPTIYSPHFSLVNKELITNCHAKNIKIIPWTVNDKKKIIQLKKM